jgi:biotin-(acetyl-CoA carboxylase) ligase
MPRAEFSFEQKIKNTTQKPEKRGSIDLLMKTPLGYGVIDFKRSAGSIPTQKSILEFEKIQLWFYLNALEVSSDEVHFSGFFNLSEPAESLFMSCDKEVKKELESLGVKTFVSKDLAADYSSYQEFEIEKVQELQQDDLFEDRPIKSDACRFCDLSNVCPRGEQ